MWLAAGAVLTGIGVFATGREELRRYRLWLVFSIWMMLAFVWIAVRVNTLAGVMLMFIALRVMMKVWAPAVSHVLTQKMADGVTDALFGARQASLPTLDFRSVKKLREESRPRDAIRHLETVLDGTPDDFESRFLLASIYAEDLRNLSEAERQIRKLESFATVSPSNKDMARQRLSTWKTAQGSAPAKSRGMQPATFHKLPAMPARPSVPSAPVLVQPPQPVVETNIASHQTVEDLCVVGSYGSAMQMLEAILAEKPDDLAGWAIKARIYVQYLAQPWQADKALRHVMDAADILPQQVEAVNKLAEALARNKEHAMKAGRLWRKLTEAPSVPIEQKVVMLSRLRKWEAAMSG